MAVGLFTKPSESVCKKREVRMLEEIRSRRSVRMFTPDQIEDHTIDQIIEMGTWAPSGLNNQPWRF